MVRQSGRGRIVFLAGLASVALVLLGVWILPDTSMPEAPPASVAAGPSEPAPESAPPQAAAPASPPQGPTTEPLSRPWLEIPSLEKRDVPEELTPAEARARELIQGYPAERADILAELEGQTLEETIAAAPAVWPSDSFTVPYGRGQFPIERQTYLLQDPRMAKILHVALHGNEAQREMVLSTATRVISDIVTQKRKRQSGEVHDASVASTAPGIGVYPIIMAELDANGETLPLLLDWYEVERGPVKSEAELSSLRESMGLPPARPGVMVMMPMTGNMFLIASAAQRISTNIGQPLLSHEELGRVQPDRTSGEFPGSEWGVDIVDELAGYDLLDEYNPLEYDQIMEALRQRLYGDGH